MNFFLALLLLMSSQLARAEGKGEEGKFEEHKKEAIEEMEAHISELQKVKSCKASAKNWEDMKACHKEMEKAKEQRRIGHLDKKIKKLQEEKERVGKNQ